MTTPYRDLTDDALARAAAQGDRDAFAQLFDRHLGDVFAEAWHVLHDRAVAAEVTRDTFAFAWPQLDAVPPDELVDSLRRSARHKAETWLEENPHGRTVAEAPAAADPPGVGPVLRARIVTALEVQGIPTRTAGGEPTFADRLLDTGPPPAGVRVGEALSRVASRFGWVTGSTRARVGGAILAVAVLGATGVTLLTGGGGAGPSGAIETASGQPAGGPGPGADDEDEPRRRPLEEPDRQTPTTTDGTATTVPAPTTSAPDDATGGGAGDDDEDGGPSPTVAAAPATTRPPTPPPTVPPATSPPTTARPTVPTILEFTGYSSGRSDCPSGQIRFHMSWKTVEATWVWVHTAGAPWEDVAGPDGSTSRCTTSGTTWYLEIRRDGDWLEDTATRTA